PPVRPIVRPRGHGRPVENVIACDKREAFAQGSKATKQSIFFCGSMDYFAEPVIWRALARPVGSQRRSQLPLRFTFLGRFPGCFLRSLFLRRRSFRDFLSFRPCLRKTDRDRLL